MIQFTNSSRSITISLNKNKELLASGFAVTKFSKKHGEVLSKSSNLLSVSLVLLQNKYKKILRGGLIRV